jgi:hypothetical protein
MTSRKATFRNEYGQILIEPVNLEFWGPYEIAQNNNWDFLGWAEDYDDSRCY